VGLRLTRFRSAAEVCPTGDRLSGLPRGNMRSLISRTSHGLVWLMLVTLGACDSAPEVAKTRADGRRSAPRAEEVEQRLGELVSYDNGLLSVYDPLLKTIFIMPSHTSWTVECGALGFRVRFGSDSENRASVTLSYLSIPHESCRSLASSAARVVAAIAGGTSPKHQGKYLCP
jgi:hypothetical protein